MLSDLTAPQRELAEYMSLLSEKAWSAGWMRGLEFDLWRALVSGAFKYGQMQISEAQCRQLRALSEACGGWIRFDEAREETFDSIEDWIVRYASWRNDGRTPAGGHPA